jgi:hypothetical protein
VSAGHDTAWTAADTDTVKRALENKAVKAQLARSRRTNDDYDLPYLAGYSKDGRTIYFDRHFPEFLEIHGRKVNARRFLQIHEETEKSLIDALGMPYPKAHPIANAVENRAVWGYGIPRASYKKAIEPYIKADQVEKLQSIPPDLDWTPYLSPPVNRALIAKMKAAEDDEKLPKSDPTVNYSSTRGSPDRHCGPDKSWPKGYCAMYGNLDCSAVAGYINPRGGCDLYEKAAD